MAVRYAVRSWQDHYRTMGLFPRRDRYSTDYYGINSFLKRNGYELPGVHLGSRRPSVGIPRVTPTPMALAAHGGEHGTRPVTAQTVRLDPVSPWLSRSASSGDKPLVLGQWSALYTGSRFKITSDPHVRLVHADVVHGSDGRAYLRPYAPTRVNGKWVFEPTAINPGDLITLGRSEFRVSAGGTKRVSSPVSAAELARPTFSESSERKKLAWLRGEHALLHPHLHSVLESVDALPEGRAMRHAQFIADSQANLSFLRSARAGAAVDAAPDDSYNIVSKTILRSAVGDSVAQPDFSVINYSGQGSPKAGAQGAQSIVSMLSRGPVFLKPDNGSLAQGVTRFELSGGELTLYSTDTNFVNRVHQMFPNSVRSSARQITLSGGNLHARMQAILDGPYASVVSHSRGANRAIAEGEIRIPKLDRRTWEIRSFHQDGRITQQFAKVGSGPEVANIADGGSRAEARETILGVYQSRYPQATLDQLNPLVDEFMRRVSENTRAVVRRLDSHLASIARRNGVTPLGRGIKHLVVDFTGQFDDEGRLIPVLLEVNKVGSLHEGISVHEPVLHRLHEMIAEERDNIAGAAAAMRFRSPRRTAVGVAPRRRTA